MFLEDKCTSEDKESGVHGKKERDQGEKKRSSNTVQVSFSESRGEGLTEYEV